MVMAMKWIHGLWLCVLVTGCVSPRAEKVSACCSAHAAAAAEGTKGSVYDLAAKWEDDSGKNLRLSDLRGRPVVLSMFYARCQGICVITRDDMQAIEASLSAKARARAQFVLVSLDPQRDTPDALRAYRAQEELPAERWRLLRGDTKTTAQLAGLLGINYGRDGSGRFIHSSQIVVLDEAGKIISSQDGVHADLEAASKILEGAGGNPGL